MKEDTRAANGNPNESGKGPCGNRLGPRLRSESDSGTVPVGDHVALQPACWLVRLSTPSSCNTPTSSTSYILQIRLHHHEYKNNPYVYMISLPRMCRLGFRTKSIAIKGQGCNVVLSLVLHANALFFGHRTSHTNTARDPKVTLFSVGDALRPTNIAKEVGNWIYWDQVFHL